MPLRPVRTAIAPWLAFRRGRVQFFERGPWLSNLSTCRLSFTSACAVEPNNESCKPSSRQLWNVADVSLPSQCSRVTRTPASQPRATRAIRSGLKTEPRAESLAVPWALRGSWRGRCCPQCSGGDRRENASCPAGARGLGDDGRRRHRCYASTFGGRRANHGREAGHAACRDSSLYGLCLPRRDLRSLQASARGGRAAIRGYVLGQRRTRRPAHASLHAANSRRCKPRGGVKTVILQEIKIRLRAIGAAAKGYPCALIRCVKNI